MSTEEQIALLKRRVDLLERNSGRKSTKIAGILGYLIAGRLLSYVLYLTSFDFLVIICLEVVYWLILIPLLILGGDEESKETQEPISQEDRDFSSLHKVPDSL
jgi:hypothetical protein